MFIDKQIILNNNRKMYSQINKPKNKVNKKKKRGSIAKDDIKKNQPTKNNNNFWDINDTNEEIINFNNIPNEDNQLKSNLIINKDNNISIEKPKNVSVYDKYKNLLKNEDKYKKNNFYYDKINLFSFGNDKKYKNKTDYRNNSVDMNKLKKVKNKNAKVDCLSVFERNRKWLETRKEKLDKQKEKYYNKKEKEMNENTFDYNKINKNKDLDINNVFNEEDNVALRPENYKFFMRLIQGRQERERSLDQAACSKINCLKKSHYSGRQNGNISQREMRKYIKFIHNELKDTNNQN